MSGEEIRFELPGKIEALLAALNRLYARQKENKLQQIIVNGAPKIDEGWTYDNWNGGTHGHAITLTIPEDMFFEIVEKKNSICTRICSDLNSLHNVKDEHIAEVFLELETRDAGGWREESGLLHPRKIVPSSPVVLSRIWRAGHVRLFFSHKAENKHQASQLKAALERYGMACFVAHQDIHPTEEWQREIEYALDTMDCMVALLTSGFHNSDWTDQEVGVALGRGTPIIAVRLGLDPYGFIGKKQALIGCSWEDIEGMAAQVYVVVQKRLADQSRLIEAALAAYASSVSTEDSEWNVKHVLSRFDSLDSAQVTKVVSAHNANPNNYMSKAGSSSLLALLEMWTGQKWREDGLDLVRKEVAETIPEDDIPF